MEFTVIVPTSGDRLEDRERLAEQLSQAARRKGHVPGSTKDDRFVVLLDGLEQDELFKPARTFTGLLEACGQHALIPETTLFMVMPMAIPGKWAIVWRTDGSTTFTGAESFGQIRSKYNDFLQKLGRPDRPLAEVSAAMESVATMWGLSSEYLELTTDDRKVGDALADALGQLATVESPPPAIVREIAGWFKRRLDLFADEFAKAAGKTGGHVAALAVGVGLSAGAAHVDLPSAIEHLWKLVS